jgi:hypothetical protein
MSKELIEVPIDPAFGVAVNVVDRARAIIVSAIRKAADSTSGDRAWLNGIADAVRDAEAVNVPSWLVLDATIAAILAIPAPVDGLVLVPREPVDAQVRAGAYQVSGLTHEGARCVYRAMLSAAPASAPVVEVADHG